MNIHFDRKCVPTADYVVLEVINRNDSMEMDGILLAQSNYSNERLGHYKVLEVGENAAREYGLVPGDFVVADRLAQTYKTEPVAIMKYVNIIAKTDKDASTFSPLKNMVFVKDFAESTQDVGGILVANYNKSLNERRSVPQRPVQEGRQGYACPWRRFLHRGNRPCVHIQVRHDLRCCQGLKEKEKWTMEF